MPRRLFKKGDPRPPGSGRRKGQTNKLQESIRLIFRNMITEEEFIDLWWNSLHSKDKNVAMDALRLMTHYMFGRPAQSPIAADDQAPPGTGLQFDTDTIITRHVPIN